MLDSIRFEGMLKQPMTELEILLHKLKNSPRQAIAFFNKFFNKWNSQKTFSYPKFWARICGIPTDNSSWDIIWKSPALFSQIIPVRIQAFKTIANWYMTPKKSVHMLQMLMTNVGDSVEV